eukprot:TRINITY_DN2307_c0_g1_i1.p1 TRINITY_DN2307_c0_g1~~TRINITY_DN2307_c0_g1_i1.p1  ORF type:complete len:374 (+),score=54.03 TRINITY_DN2307_c0_g1_i1:57-1178(+)
MRLLAFVAFICICCCCFLTCVNCGRDFYGILGVDRSANDEAIQKAFHKLSRKYHPDKNPGDKKAHEKYLDITAAHDVLSNPDSRQTYDLHGEEGLNKQQQGGGVNPFDPFGGLFGGQGGKKRGPDFKTELSVSLEDLYLGGTRTIRVSRKVICPHCRGTGAKGAASKPCKVCGGSGVQLKTQQMGPGFNVQFQSPCEACGGTGKIIKDKCPHCQGHKTVMEEKALDAVIERGMKDGEEIVFERASEQAPDMIPGNVILVLKQQAHSRFRREGNDLHYDQTITLKEALLGFKRQIAHLDGRTIDVESDEVTPPDTVRVIEGEGMPLHDIPSESGNLRVKFSVSFPSRLTNEQKKAIRQLLAPNGEGTENLLAIE